LIARTWAERDDVVDSGQTWSPGDNGWWVTGFVDGEGCFYATLLLRTKRAPNSEDYPCVNLDAGLQIQLRSDDEATLVKIRDYFGFGNMQLKPVSEARKRAVPGSKPSASLRLYGIESLVERVIPHFAKYPLQSKKVRDYEIWRELVEFTYDRLHGRKGWRRKFPAEVARVYDLCERLKSVRNYAEVVDG
jgi:hypothetical protein